MTSVRFVFSPVSSFIITSKLLSATTTKFPVHTPTETTKNHIVFPCLRMLCIRVNTNSFTHYPITEWATQLYITYKQGKIEPFSMVQNTGNVSTTDYTMRIEITTHTQTTQQQRQERHTRNYANVVGNSHLP